MFDFITHNFYTILVGGLVAVLIIAVAVKMIRDKKRGKSSCGCHCADCPSKGICHTKS